MVKINVYGFETYSYVTRKTEKRTKKTKNKMKKGGGKIKSEMEMDKISRIKKGS